MRLATRPFRGGRRRLTRRERGSAYEGRWACLPLALKGAVVITIPLGALIVTVLLSSALNAQVADAVRWVDHSHRVRTGIQEVFTLTSEASTGMRGFLLVGEDAFLDPYRRAQAALPGSLTALRAQVSDNPEQRARAERVYRLAHEQLAGLGTLRLTHATEAQPAAATEPTNAKTGRTTRTVSELLSANKTDLDALRAELHAMTRAEEALLEARTARLDALRRWQQRGALVALAVGVIGSLLAGWLFLAGVTRRVDYVAANARRLAQGVPLHPPLPGRDALGRLGGALDRAAKRLREGADELRESEARLRNVISAAPVALLALRADGTFTFSEGRGLDALGQAPGELVGRSLFEVYRDLPQVLENHTRALSGESFTSQLEVAGRSFDLRYAPVFEYGRVSDVTVVVNDVTERRRAERVLLHYQRMLERQNGQLARAVRAKDEFLAHMSHELRTPLTAILGFSDLLQDPYFGALNAKQREYAETISSAGEHLLSLINDLLDLSKIEAGGMALYPSAISLADTVAEAVAVIEGQAQKKSLRLRTDVPPALPPLSADARKVKQILYNLLSNAVKFTPAQGEVELYVREREGEVCVEVRDTGPGISPEQQALLFKPFSQLRAAEAELQGMTGTGLGLALTKQLVELHGGRVWLRSRVGRGSTFGFSLPRRPPYPSAEV